MYKPIFFINLDNNKLMKTYHVYIQYNRQHLISHQTTTLTLDITFLTPGTQLAHYESN